MTHSLPLLGRIWLDLATSRKKQSWFWQSPSPPSPQLLERNHRKRRLYWAVDLYIQIETFTFCVILVQTDQISLIFCLFMLSFRSTYGFTMKMIKYLFFFHLNLVKGFESILSWLDSLILGFTLVDFFPLIQFFSFNSIIFEYIFAYVIWSGFKRMSGCP